MPEHEDDINAPQEDDMEDLKRRAKALEEEAAQLKAMQAQLEEQGQETETSEADSRSVFVGNVDYGTTPEELQQHFSACGAINRVTILTDRFGNPKGHAYIEFVDGASVNNALVLNESLFRGRLLQVSPKRTNVPWAKRGRGGFRGGRARGGFRGGRGRGTFRGRRGSFAPY